MVGVVLVVLYFARVVCIFLGLFLVGLLFVLWLFCFLRVVVGSV
jgi:hypothetical protein